ncbi:MAG: 30S ribosomal protein S6 [bacterium]
MNHYESVTLLVPEFSEKDVQKYVDDLGELLTRLGAVELSPARVDRRALAYPIKKHNEGFYVYIRCDAPPTLPATVRAEFKHREGILRLAFVRRPKLAPEPEQPAAPPPPADELDQPDMAPDLPPDTEAADDPEPQAERNDG